MTAAKKMADGDTALVKLKAEAAVEFRGLFRVRLLLGEDGVRRVIVNDVADGLGVSTGSFHNRASRQFRRGLSMMKIPTAGGVQPVLTIDIHYLPALLLGAEVERCRETIRPRLTEIQKELTAALAAYTFEGQAVNPEFQRATVGEVRQVERGLVGEPITVDARTGRVVERREDTAAMLSKLFDFFSAQIAASEARAAEARASDRAFIERMLGAAGVVTHQPAAGPGFARQLCRDLDVYAAMMAPEGDRGAVKMWRGKGETGLRERLGYSGKGSAWRRLPATKRDDATRAMEIMLDTARTLQGQRAAAAQGDLFKKH